MKKQLSGLLLTSAVLAALTFVFSPALLDEKEDPSRRSGLSGSANNPTDKSMTETRDGKQVTDGQSKEPDGPYIELIQDTAGFELGDREASAAALDRFMNNVEPDSVDRWRAVILDPSQIVAGTFQSRDAESVIAPVKHIRISPFPEIKFDVDLQDYKESEWSGTWVGQIVAGGTGTVTAHLVPNESGQIVAAIYIDSDAGHFNVAPTDDYPFYVAMRGNPYHRPNFD